MENIILSPEEFFGHQMGADRKLARWDKIVEYFWLLDCSPCVKVTELGKSTMGNPFLLVIISSPENIENIDKIREMSLLISHPKNLTEEDVEKLIAEGKAVVMMDLSLHATEVGGTQMAPELAYELATSQDREILKIRENTVLVLIPCFNPDGNIMVVDWYNQWLDTEYEGVNPPFLYNKYTGHDNNRDAFHLTQVESQIHARIMYRDWYPQTYLNMHHMGSYGARYFVPPHGNPVQKELSPLVRTEMMFYGGLMSVMLEAAGKTGIESGVQYPNELFPGFDGVPRFHNICSMLTESASAKLATPMYIHHQQLKPPLRGLPEYSAHRGFPHPWPGGWWKLRDIVEQQKISAFATLKAVSKFKDMVLRNMYLKAKNSIELGINYPPYAFIIKPKQHDILTTYKFLKMMSDNDVEISLSRNEFTAEGVLYPKGTFIIFTAQTCRPYIISLLRQDFYDPGPFNWESDGTPIPPQARDATNSVAESMGIDIHEVKNSFSGDYEQIKSITFPKGLVKDGSNFGYLLEGNINESYAVVNQLLQKGIEVNQILEDIQISGKTFKIGSFFIPNEDGLKKELKKLSEQHHIVFHAAKTMDFEKKPLKQLRIGLYKRYWGGNMQEGWTRWLFDQYGFEYDTLWDKEIKEGKLAAKYDVIILPSDHKSLILGKGIEEYYEKRYKGRRNIPNYPPEYRSGIGDEGVEKLREFIEAGGTLVTISEASNFAIDEFKLPLKNVLNNLKPKDFLCPSSNLRIKINKRSQLTYGVSDDMLIRFKDNLAFEVIEGMNNENMKIVLSYPERRIMQSGWLIGEKYLSRKAALIDAKLGKGRIILFGFSPQYRAQTDATFKLLFNCLFA